MQTHDVTVCYSLLLSHLRRLSYCLLSCVLNVFILRFSSNMNGSDPSYPLFPIFAFLGFILAITPLSWHLQAWNSGTCIYMFWASFSCLVQFVNSVVWHGNTNNPAPIWCDICSYRWLSSRVISELLISHLATKFMIGAAVGIPAASLCINRRLFNIANMKTASVTRAEVCNSTIALHLLL